MSDLKAPKGRGPAGLAWYERAGLILAMILVCLGTFTDIARADESRLSGFYATVAKTIPNIGSTPTGVAGIGYRWAKYDIAATYVAPAPIYGGQLDLPAFGMLSISRHWKYKARSWLGGGSPTWLMGVSLKGADRCAYNGETDCNRRLPLPVNFHFGLGLEWQDIRVELYHDSNNAMDWGPEKKNYSLNYVGLSVLL